MATVIAEIRLAPGEVGYYDDYSRIYLNASRPTAKIYAGMNTTQIRRSIRSGRLILISGSLSAPAPAAKPEPVKKPAPAPAKKAPEPVVEEPKPEPVAPVIEETVEPEPVVEAEPEEIAEEIIEEPAPEPEETTRPKRRSRRKQAAEAE